MNKNIGDMTESELKDFIIELQEENSRLERNLDERIDAWQELKKQLEEKEKIACNWKDSCLENAGKIEKAENQQQEFIKYLEDEIKELQKIKETELDYDLRKDVTTQLLDYKDALQKYKSIIGVKDEK